MDRATVTAYRQNHLAVRRLIVAVAGMAVWSCASPSTPPGGVVDEDPPQLVALRPDTLAVNVRVGWVGLDFDEVISERPQGAPALADLFLISPGDGQTEVSWRRTRLEVRPAGGLKPNTTYTVRMLPGLVDLDGNADSVGLVVVFSTGPTIARAAIRGVVFDWMADKGATRAFVEAITLPDSTRYLAYSDSSGRFEISHLPAGRYTLRTVLDQNNNRRLDLRELWDTLTVDLTDSLRRDLHAIMRDTLGAGIERVEMIDSLTLRVRFDRALDTTVVYTPQMFTLRKSDSTDIAIFSAVGGREVDREKAEAARLKAIQDSLRADSTSRSDTSAARRPAAPARPRAPRVAPIVRPRPGADTVPELPAPKMTVRRPDVDVILKLTTVLPHTSSFSLRTEGIPSILGKRRRSQRSFTTPKPTKAADSTAVDSTQRGARPDAAPRLPRPDTARHGATRSGR